MMSIPMPTDNAIDIACEWLAVNEGEENNERKSCQEVATWLRVMQQDRMLKQTARENKIPVKWLRKKIKHNRE